MGAWLQAAVMQAGFVPGGGGSGIPSGCILLWSGSIVSIPSGWALCDGSSGTPDLRDAFLVGAGGAYPVAGIGGAASHTHAFTGAPAATSADTAGTPAGTNAAPAFTGNSGNTSSDSAGTPAGTNSAPAFTGNSNTTNAVTAGTPAGTNNAPAFTGTPFSSIINHIHPVNVQGGTTAATTGTHCMTSTATGGSARAITAGDAVQNPAGGVASITPAGTVAAPVFTGSALGTHSHTVTPTGTVGAPAFTGTALGTHNHSLVPAGTVAAPVFTGATLGTHSHTFTPAGANAVASNIPPYYALCYIMKL